MVAAGFDAAVLHSVAVVILAAPQLCRCETGAELKALHCRDTKDDAGNAVFHAAEHGVSQADGQAQHRALDHAAQAVPLGLGLGDGRLHGFPGGLIYGGEGLLRRGGAQGGGVLHIADGADAGDDFNAPALQNLQADAPGDAQGGRQPAGKVAAAGIVLTAEIFHVGGIVRVARPGHRGEGSVVLGAGVPIADDGGQGHAAGGISPQPRQKLRGVRLFAGGGIGVAAGSPALQEALQGLKIDLLPGGDALQGHADGGGVGLAENGQVKVLTVHAAHRLPPVNEPKSSQKRG